MRELEIPIRRAGFQPQLPNDYALYYEMYWTREMTMAEIAAELGAVPSAVFGVMQKIGIPTRPASMVPGRKLTKRLDGLVSLDLPLDVREEVKQQAALEILTRQIPARAVQGALDRLVRKAYRDCRGNLREISIDAERPSGLRLSESLEG